MNMEKLRAWARGALKSWTMWFNGLMGTLVIAMPVLQDSMPQLAPYLDPGTYRDLALAVLAVNLLLRVKTKTALEDR